MSSARRRSPPPAPPGPPPRARARSEGRRSAAMPSGPRRPKCIPDAAYGLDQRVAVRVELLAQVADVGLEDAVVTPEVVVPHVVEQPRPRHDTPRLEHQVAEQS